jgi:hypothetical protein
VGERKCGVRDEKVPAHPGGKGAFEVRERKPRRARNPYTGEAVDVPAKRLVTLASGSYHENEQPCAHSCVDPRSVFMKQRIFIIGGFLVAIVLGLGIGYLAGRNSLPRQELTENAADLKPEDVERVGQDWKYPGCSAHDSSQGGGGKIGSAIVSPHYCLVMTTPDDYEAVLKFYADKTGIPSLVAGTGGGSRGSFDSKTGSLETWFVLNDSLSPEGPNRSRTVKAKMFGKSTPTYDLTILVSRANDEKHTHIVLAYYPRK